MRKSETIEQLEKLLDSCLLDGEMMKLSPSAFRSWQQRYFRISDQALEYWKTNQDFTLGYPPRGVVNFNFT